MSYARKSVYLCRAPLCKHKNVVWECVDSDNQVIETAPAWKQQCGRCGRQSLDLIFQQVFKPETTLSNYSSTSRDRRRPKDSDPTT